MVTQNEMASAHTIGARVVGANRPVVGVTSLL
jgi:hypothetical protein